MTSEQFAAKTQKLFNRKRPLSGCISTLKRTQPPTLFQSFSKSLSSPATIINTKSGESFTPNIRELSLELPTKHVIRQSCTNSIGGINTKNPESVPRLLSVKPTTLAFGIIRLGCTYRYTFTIQNIGYESGRYRINPPNNPCIWCITKGNRVAPGMIHTLQLEFLAVQEGDINETIQIYTECEIYNIPITALVLNAVEYEKYLNQRRRHNRPLYPDNVKLFSAIPTSTRPDITNTEIKEIQDGVDEFHIPMDTIDNPDIDIEEREDILNMPSLPHVYWDRNEQKMIKLPYQFSTYTNDELELSQIQQQFALLEIDKLQQDYRNVPPSGILLYKKLWTDQYDETKSSLLHPHYNNTTTNSNTNLDETLYTTNTKKNTMSSSSILNNTESQSKLQLPPPPPQQQQQRVNPTEETLPSNKPIIPQPMKFPENENIIRMKKEYNPSPLSQESNVIYSEDISNENENNERNSETGNNNKIRSLTNNTSVSRRTSSSSSKRSSIKSLYMASEALPMKPPPLQLHTTSSEPIMMKHNNNNINKNNSNGRNNNKIFNNNFYNHLTSPSPISFNHKSFDKPINLPPSNYEDKEEREIRRSSNNNNINQQQLSNQKMSFNSSRSVVKVEDVDDLLLVDEDIKLSNNKEEKEIEKVENQQQKPPLAPPVEYSHLESFVSDSVQEWSQELEHLTPREIEIKNCAPVIGKEDERLLEETDAKILQRMLKLLDK